MTVRITKVDKALEAELRSRNNDALKKWLSVQTTELEQRLRFASGGDIQILQGALRTLDDIADILKT